jgi:PhzF family phenazine biosynthesis protein
MGTRIVQVDAFTDRPFAGNPAAVCVLDSTRPDEWMQDVAAEMNLSETAFLEAAEDGYRLRWFTPTVEVDLCGHATLASAHMLWEEGFLPANAPARFSTRSGLLIAEKRGEWIEMDFPAMAPQHCRAPDGLSAALGAEPRFTGSSRFDLLVEVESEQVVRLLTPNLRLLKELPVRGVIVTALAEPGSGVDFVSRFFAPAAGVDEDPVTGSAHCVLAPFWSERLQRNELKGYQASRRGGMVGTRVAGDRVILRGKAVTTLRGELV